MQAGFQLRFAQVAKAVRENALSLEQLLNTEAQMIALSAFQLALVSCVAVLDLGAASLVGLAGLDLSSGHPTCARSLRGGGESWQR